MRITKTRVYVGFNGADNVYTFDCNKEAFMKKWDNMMPVCGFFSMDDESGNFIVISPSQCGTIEVHEVDQ